MTAVLSVGYDVLFLVHLVAAITVVVVLASLRLSARSVARAPRSVQRTRFPDRTNWAVRTVHVLPVTGVALSLTGPKDVALSRPWVGAGLLGYLALAYWLEARTLPVERTLAASIQSEGEVDVHAARQLAGRLDTALAVLAAILVTMIVQF